MSAYQEVTPQEVAEQLAASKTVSIIDVREEEEVKEGKIPGAVNIPLGQIPHRLHEIDKVKGHIMVCRSGSRSGQAAEYLQANGYKIANMAGGMLRWEGPVE
ncbi:Rhodanese-related sulfurtransferase [Evansella caseinilytica]|uniref:Rhodanese-related sulfurtransferase n=1 Tax=Evansella caseinilytica TaxID=1503961 RepID=A0A1H3UPL8_9BACI|nr:rhodanese-like domain-containing protein [Evansella caseinilytica]SDZ64392.1 Rhodanese-related sulfurtransferase [Evansella caseinilytica]